MTQRFQWVKVQGSVHHGLLSTDTMDWADYFYAVCLNSQTGPDLGSPDWTMENTAL